MKKITLILVALFVGATAFAQDVVIHRGPDGSTGLISTEGEDGVGVYTADYFVLEEETLLGEFYFFGFPSDGSQNMDVVVTGFNLFIYEHDGFGAPDGIPGDESAILELPNISTDKFDNDPVGTTWNFKVNVTVANDDVDVTLPAGEYWVSASPVVQGELTGPGRWNWVENVSANVAQEPQLVDPYDVFEAGATVWLPISDLIGEPFNAFAWTLTEGGILGVDEFETNSFKHLVKNNQLLLTSDLEIADVAIYNSLGQKVASQLVNSTSTEINLSNLSSGVYFTQANVNGETKTFKFAK